MLTCDIDRIQINDQTQIKLFTDHRNWVQSPASAQAPVFLPPSGLLILTQQILDDHTALLTVNPTTANTLCTLTDTMNAEAITLKCWDTPQFLAMGEADLSDNISPPTESNNPIDDGYWNSSLDEVGFSGEGLI